MLDDIGITAGEIWHFLEVYDEASIGKLIKELNKIERVIVVGIGWLAPEEKLSTIQRQRFTYFMLNYSSAAIGGNNL